jgi:hypothetical protein
MANTVIQLKHSTLTGNVPSSLANGEISINSRDGKFFYSTPAGVVVTHYPYPGPAGLNQEIQFNDSGVLGSDSGLTYNKTTDVLTVVGGAIVGGVNVTPQIQLAFTQANTPSHVANSAASYANSAFSTANSAGGAAAASSYANSAFGKANTAAVAANTPSHVANSAASYANSSFARANNSLDANNGGTVTGTITATSFITTGSFGNILGANTIYANNFVANTGFIQFADGSKQYTANAGSGGGGGTTDWGFGIIYTANNNTFANAAAANSQVNFVGENGTVVYANAATKTITFAGTPGLQGLTVDYGFVNDPTYYSIDYGSLA